MPGFSLERTLEIFSAGPDDEEIARLVRTVTLGKVLASGLAVNDSALNVILARAEKDAIEAGQAFMESDLTTETGVRQAMAWQMRYHRFVQVIEWIYEIGADADEADNRLEEMGLADDDAEIRRELDGRPEQPTD